jgi:hypothetical protein
MSGTSSDYGENGFLVLTAMTSLDIIEEATYFEDD